MGGDPLESWEARTAVGPTGLEGDDRWGKPNGLSVRGCPWASVAGWARRAAVMLLPPHFEAPIDGAEF